VNTVLKNIVRFTSLIVGVPVALLHRLNVNGVLVAPQIVLPQRGGCVVTANATNITVTRQAGGPAALDVYVEHWHTIESVTPLVPPPGKLVGLVPFVIDPGGGGGGGSDNPFALPQQWIVANLLANTPPTPAEPNFINGFFGTPDTLRMIRSGSIVGLGTVVVFGVIAGTLTVKVTKNGAPGAITIIHTVGGNPQGGQVTQVPGIDTYVAGDLIGIQWETDAGYQPSGESSLVGVWLEAFEVLP
jgi:hypothetical protein